ncbi:MAG: hypothetical protein ACOCQA_00700 [bacterium]
MNIRESIEEIITGKNNLYIEVIRGGVKTDQSTDSIAVFEDEEYLKLITDNTDYRINKEKIDNWYNSDDTITFEFNRYEKVVIRAIGQKNKKSYKITAEINGDNEPLETSIRAENEKEAREMFTQVRKVKEENYKIINIEEYTGK